MAWSACSTGGVEMFSTAFFFAAASVAFTAFIMHTFTGGVRVARPLLADTTLPKASKWLNYYCWHITTVFLLAMCASFIYAGFERGGVDVAALMTALALVYACLSAWVAMKGAIPPLRFPSTWLFAAAAVLGGAGVYFSIVAG